MSTPRTSTPRARLARMSTPRPRLAVHASRASRLARLVHRLVHASYRRRPLYRHPLYSFPDKGLSASSTRIFAAISLTAIIFGSAMIFAGLRFSLTFSTDWSKARKCLRSLGLFNKAPDFKARETPPSSNTPQMASVNEEIPSGPPFTHNCNCMSMSANSCNALIIVEITTIYTLDIDLRECGHQD